MRSFAKRASEKSSSTVSKTSVLFMDIAECMDSRTRSKSLPPKNSDLLDIHQRRNSHKTANSNG